MYDKLTGYNNEYNFVCLFNGKKVGELDPIGRDMIYKIFNNISDNDVVKCWRNHLQQKGDIMIKIRNAIKSLSIKMGAKNSLHTEHIHFFIEFLKENNIPTNIIKYYLEYHYLDGTLSGNGVNRMSVNDYKKINQEKIDMMNKYFLDYNFLLRCIDRFILKGKNSDYKISGIIYGIPSDYIFLSNSEITSIMLERMDDYSSGVHVSRMFIQPKARDLNNTNKYDKDRHLIQVKWFNILDDFMIHNFKNL